MWTMFEKVHDDVPWNRANQFYVGKKHACVWSVTCVLSVVFGCYIIENNVAMIHQTVNVQAIKFVRLNASRFGQNKYDSWLNLINKMHGEHLLGLGTANKLHLMEG